MKKASIILISWVFMSTSMLAQQAIAVLNMDVQGLGYSSETMGNLLRLEVEKTGKYHVLDKYDLAYILKKEKFDINNCFGRICLVEAGKLLNAEKVLSGSLEKFDNKIILTLRLVDVKKEVVEKTDIMEYLDLPEIQKMIEVSVYNIFDMETNPQLVDMLSTYDEPISTPKTQLRLNGPRMGFSYIGGTNGKILQAPKSEGGFDMQPYSTLIGYQQEISYLSSGNFQALFEIIGLVGGMEQGRFVPSLTIMNGLRSNKSGFEIAFGPLIEVTKVAEGFYDAGGKWRLVDEWHENPDNYEERYYDWGSERILLPIPYNIETRLDSRGNAQLTTAWVWAVGKTFRSGHLNIPFNLYLTMKKTGWTTGFSFGFNISKR